MKEVITQHELNILDRIAVSAATLEQTIYAVAVVPRAVDRVRDSQRSMAAIVESILLVEHWDTDKRRAIEEYIFDGAKVHVDTFVEGLGIAIHDPLVPDTNHAGEAGSTQGGSDDGHGGREQWDG